MHPRAGPRAGNQSKSSTQASRRGRVDTPQGLLSSERTSPVECSLRQIEVKNGCRKRHIQHIPHAPCVAPHWAGRNLQCGLQTCEEPWAMMCGHICPPLILGSCSEKLSVQSAMVCIVLWSCSCVHRSLRAAHNIHVPRSLMCLPDLSIACCPMCCLLRLGRGLLSWHQTRTNLYVSTKHPQHTSTD